MAERPYTVLSASMSLDGFLDDASDRRGSCSPTTRTSIASTRCAPSCDAILVGATTVRHDNPRLLVRSQDRRDARAARGPRPTPSRSR